MASLWHIYLRFLWQNESNQIVFGFKIKNCLVTENTKISKHIQSLVKSNKNETVRFL